MPMETKTPSKGKKSLEEMTEEELLAELEKSSIGEALGPVVDEAVLEKRALMERKIHQKHLRTKKPLRNKLQPQEIIEVEIDQQQQQRNTRWILPEEPTTRRAEFVEDILRPGLLRFFQRVKCDCEECMGSGDRRWDTLNGMKCLLSLKGEVPAKRQIRRMKKKENNFVSPLLRRVSTMKGMNNDVFNSNGGSPSNQLSLSPKDKKQRSIGSSDWIAEVVVIMSSLRSSRCPFNDSLRVMHLLECKGVEYFAIDVNSDVGIDLPDKALIARWRHLHWVFRDPSKTTINKTKRDVMVPQVLIDGVPIGGIHELQMLEEENDLDYILAREACPNCLKNRMVVCGRPPKLNPDGTRVTRIEDQFPNDPVTGQSIYPKDYCFHCGSVFRELINTEVLPPENLQLLVKRSLKRFDHQDVASFKKTKELINQRLPMQMIGEDFSLPTALQKGDQYREQRMLEL